MGAARPSPTYSKRPCQATTSTRASPTPSAPPGCAGPASSTSRSTGSAAAASAARSGARRSCCSPPPGANPGEPRTAPVVYLADGDNVSLINTNAGNAKTPAWSFNLKANPEAEVEIGRERRPVRARIAEGAEHDDLWRKHNEQYAGFDDYKAKLDREPSVFVLEPR